MNVLTVTWNHYTTRVLRLKMWLAHQLLLPTQAPALVARHANVRTVAAKNMRVRSRYADSSSVCKSGDYFRINRNIGSPSTMFVM